MCENCEWEEELDRATKMIEQGQFDFALETLEGIKDWVQENEHITDRQSTALDNIERSVEGR